jgi:dihydroorotase
LPAHESISDRRPRKAQLWCVFIFCFLTARAAAGQSYDILLKHGHVIDPASQIDRVMDIAIADGKIARVATSLPEAQARKVLDVKGLYITPGLIDLHAHVYGYSGSLFPDDTALFAGTTTVVDAGGAGWRSFDDFKQRIISRSRTRVLAFLNIVGRGMWGQKRKTISKIWTRSRRRLKSMRTQTALWA